MSVASSIESENKRLEKEASKAYDLLLGKFKDALDTKSGRDIVWYILSLCGLYDNKFHGNSSTFFEEGKRAIGLEVLQLLNDVDRKLYIKMQTENLE